MLLLICILFSLLVVPLLVIMFCFFFSPFTENNKHLFETIKILLGALEAQYGDQSCFVFFFFLIWTMILLEIEGPVVEY